MLGNLLLKERCCYAGVAHPASPLHQAEPVKSQSGALLNKAFCLLPERQIGGSSQFPRSSPAPWSHTGFSDGQFFLGREMAHRGDRRLCSCRCKMPVSQQQFFFLRWLGFLMRQHRRLCFGWKHLLMALKIGGGLGEAFPVCFSSIHFPAGNRRAS